MFFSPGPSRDQEKIVYSIIYYVPQAHGERLGKKTERRKCIPAKLFGQKVPP
jgi:hypothetical protein